MSDPTAVSEREQTERLCRFMGWNEARRDVVEDQRPCFVMYPPGAFVMRSGDTKSTWWRPFVSADHDYEVLERARLLWDGDKREPKNPNAWRRLLDNLPYPENYVSGDWSRSVLRVLEESETL